MSAEGSEEMWEEEEWVGKMIEVFDFARGFYDALSGEQKNKIISEKERKKEEIRRFLAEGDKASLLGLSPEMQKLLGLIGEKLENIKTKDPELYRHCIDFFLRD